MQPPLDLKQILPFPLEPTPTLGLFGNYSTVSMVPPPLLCGPDLSPDHLQILPLGLTHPRFL